MCSSWCHWYPKTPKSLASFKSRLVLPFWYRANPGCPGKETVNGCNSSSSSSSFCIVFASDVDRFATAIVIALDAGCCQADTSCVSLHTPINSKQQQPPFYGHYTPSTCVSRHLRLRTGGFCWCKVSLHALADGNQRIRISEKTLEFSSTVLSTSSPYIVIFDR